MSQLTLTDALDHYRSVAEATHRFWAYFQVVAVGLVSYAWSIAPRNCVTFLGLTVAFIVFAKFNGALVLGSQKEACLTADAIKGYVVVHPDAVPKQFVPFVQEISPKPVRHIRGIYIWLVVATVGAVWVRLWFD